VDTQLKQVPNRLINETSPYLLQHANNPVDWYPWSEEAFQKAKIENKPVFLSVGYSTCHWCHVMAHESFEDAEVASILNRNFVSIKVDKEERPDVDSIYMNVCMALTGSGGWPLTVVMDHKGKPFFSGTYFPKHGRYRMPGLIDLLNAIHEKWQSNREELMDSAGEITAYISSERKIPSRKFDFDQLINRSIAYFESEFDINYGGFGQPPKFPSPHNLLFLLDAYENINNQACLEMAEKTLISMAEGGIFDHIGFGFSRYSTDEKWLVPHFEKMLYDNALLIMAYTKAYGITKNPVYKAIVEKTILFIKREMTNPKGGFYSAQDADSDGVEGKYYVFTPEEIVSVLGETHGRNFCKSYDITESGNFEGTGIPNRIDKPVFDDNMSDSLEMLYEYRKTRTKLHKDDKILTSWNSLTIAALSDAAIALGDKSYLELAEQAVCFIEMNLCENNSVFASFRESKRTDSGFLDDYAFYIYALLRLYYSTLKSNYLERANLLVQKVISDFSDSTNGGFYLTDGKDETLMARPKEAYDGAIPSGNSMMTMNLNLLNLLTGEYEEILNKQVDYMSSQSAAHPSGYSFFLYSLLKKNFPDKKITAVLSSPSERADAEAQLKGKGWIIILEHETDEYKLKDNKTTYYVCEQNTCYPAQNEIYKGPK